MDWIYVKRHRIEHPERFEDLNVNKEKYLVSWNGKKTNFIEINLNGKNDIENPSTNEE